MPQLAFANTFWDKYEQLEKPVRAGVRKAMKKFQQLSVAELHADKGLHLESVEKAADRRMRTIRITDFWRGVVLAPDDGSDTFLLVNVVPHDKAYEWAAKRLYTINSATRGLEVRNAVVIEQLTPVLEHKAAQASARLFDGLSDASLSRLGIDDGTLRAARTILDKPQLEAFASLFPEDQFEVLQFLAEGYDEDTVWREVVALRRPADAGPYDPDDLSSAIANTHSRITVVTGAEELEDILTKPFAAWRIFLHPAQRRVAYRATFGGPAQVSGGPGTGKTVVALHRVKHLLQRSPRTSRILLTTYTTALAQSLRENLALLLEDDALLRHVDITTVDALARDVVRRLRGSVPRLCDDADERFRWRKIRQSLALDWSEQFLSQEYRHVVLAQSIGTEDEYLRAVRRGRGSALGPVKRVQVWRAVKMFEEGLRKDGKCTYLQLCAEAARLLNRTAETPYAHVVVDEAQDLHPVQWRVLRGAVTPGPDDLFITGDPHQRIYDSRVSLGSLGIPVAGRSSRLRINYRSTEEILRWAAQLMQEETVESLSGDGLDSLAGYRSLLHGHRPSLADFSREEAELTAVVEKVRSWVAGGVAPTDIAVTARFHQTLDKVRARMERAGLPVVMVKDGPTHQDDGLRLATLHAMKGLEFRCVAVIGVTAGAFPFPPAVTPLDVDPMQHRTDMLTERCLLFVACTRAREELHVSHSGKGSRFLPSEQ
ncbi:DNA helicase UvrD [Streptomyces montanus]|uniref:DNA 3'-5' helicase n=1 Tax=Streptomyces montanus TaxID=2580423 RepID=A0A5R9G735_9ACTN|nr:UvrD-helicase domain-containing protein [Streptomyces montanus]TLS47315.1 DNA helicase UvrD [Streptomyces montanus]